MHRLLVAVIVVGLGLAGVIACSGGSSSSHSSSGGRSTPSAQGSASSLGVTSPTASSSGNPTAASASASTPPTAATLVAYVRAGRPVAGADFGMGASGPGQPMTATPGIEEFSTPSGNISCGILGTGTEVMCSVKDYSYPTPPRPADCHLNYAPGWVSLSSSGVTRSLCLGGPPFPPVSRTLAYGSTLSDGPMTCRSEAAFLACADTGTGHGFAVSRTTLTTY
jgi:hypothetical protein